MSKNEFYKRRHRLKLIQWLIDEHQTIRGASHAELMRLYMIATHDPDDITEYDVTLLAVLAMNSSVDANARSYLFYVTGCPAHT